MTHTQHTQGPWTEKDRMIFAANGLKIADCLIHYDDGDLPDEEVLANARLIAAAPVMLAMLRQALTALNTAPRFKVGDTDSYAIASRIGHVIQQATLQE